MPREIPAIRLICSFKIRLESYSLIFFLAIFDGTKTPPTKKKQKLPETTKTQKRTPGKKTKNSVKRNVRIYIYTEKMTQKNVQIW
jgi:hypothetical protein